jgi:type II pantothenate kinase
VTSIVIACNWARRVASFPPSPHLPGDGRLFVCSNGQGSPCLDLRRVPCALADACVGADLVVVEGLGRAIHTNFRARFRGASSLKLAMIKNAHLAEALLGGEIMDCVCLFEEGLEE